MCIACIMSTSQNPTKEIPIEDPYTYLGNISRKQFQKLLFISNALENGWTVKKQQQQYFFTKKHENKKEVFQENYLEQFILENNNLDTFLEKHDNL